MDVKAEVVLLIFTLNCVTLILLGQDLIRFRLCQDRFADSLACGTDRLTTKTTITTHLAITTITTTTPTSTPIHHNNTVPVSTTVTTNTPSFHITIILPLRRQSPPQSPPQQSSSQELNHLFLLPPLLPRKERENAPLTQSSPSPPSPLSSSASSGFSGDMADKDEEEDLTKEVMTWALVVIATFVCTSLASSQVLGRWIDRWSCRTTAFFPLTGVVVWAACGILVTAAPYLPLSLWLVGAAVGGSSGGFVTLRAAATIYAVQAAPHWDSTVRLAFLQAATSLGVLLAYLSWYFIAADPEDGMTATFIGIMVLGMLNIFFVLVFLSDKTPTPPVTTTTTASPGAARGTQIIAHDSSSIVGRRVSREEREEDEAKSEERGKDEDDGEDDRDTGSKEKVRKMGRYEREIVTTAGMDNQDEWDGTRWRNFGKAKTSNSKKPQKDSDVGPRRRSSLPINIFMTPPEANAGPEQMKSTVVSPTPKSKRKRKLGVIHNFVHLNSWIEEDERSHDSETSGSWTKRGIPSPQNKIHIIINPEDGSSVYGTPPEQSNLPVSRCGTPPSRDPSCYLSCTSLETAAADRQRSGLTTGQQQPEAHAGASSYDHLPYYEPQRHQITGLSSSAPSTFPSLMEERSVAAPDVPLEETQTVNKTEVIHSQGDMLTVPNVLLDLASSLGSVLGCEGSNTSSNNSIIGSSSGESRDVMRGDARDMLYDCASLGDMQGPLPLSTSTITTLGSSYDSTSLRPPGSILTLQSEGVSEVDEREGRGVLVPLTVAGESGGEGGCCAGGGGAGRCLACVAGRPLCRPVSLTFRRREAGLRGIVVADVVAAFLVSVVRAGVWEVTPLYLESKVEWSLAYRISYLACRSCLGVVALVVVLPLLRRLWSLQDTTLGVLGGVSSLLSSICLSALSSSSSVILIAILLGPLTPYLNVASSAILLRLVAVTELGGVLVCLGSVEQAGHVIGWLTFHYLFPLLLLHRMPGVTFLTTGLMLVAASTIFGVLYFSLGLRNSRSSRGRSVSRISHVSARSTQRSAEGARS